MTQPPVVIFGDHIAAYGVVRALGPEGIRIYIVSPKGTGPTLHSRYVRKSLVLPSEAEGFIDQVNRWLAKEGLGESVLMVAGDDGYLSALAQGYHDLTPSLKRTFPDWEAVKLVRRKSVTCQIADRLGVPIPRTHYVTSLEQLNAVGVQFAESDFPLIMKAEDSARFFGRFGIKGVVCRGRDELARLYAQYESFFGELILQTLVPGPESALYCLKTVLNEGSQPVAVFVDRKIRSSGEFLSCSLTVSTWADEVVRYGTRLLSEIGYRGYASVEFKQDARDGLYRLMEINGRFSMNNSHALRCGINFPLIAYHEAVGRTKTPLTEFKKAYLEGVLWWSPLTEKKAVRGLLGWGVLREYVRTCVGRPYIIELVNWRDPFLVLWLARFSLKWLTRRLFQLGRKLLP